MSARPAFGRLLRHFRASRGLSQLTLALDVETTTRHLSYLENGRSRPRRELVLRLADALDLPLRARNELLIAAGLAAEFPSHSLGDAALAPYRAAVARLLDALEPYPAFVVDSVLDLEEANTAGRRMLASGLERPNLVDVFLAPGPARESLVNFADVAWSWRDRFLRATAHLDAREDLAPIRARLDEYLADVPRPPFDAQGELVLCPTFRIGDRTVRTIGMTMRFGPSRDVTLEELSVEVLQPRDEEADRFFRELAG
ncbi:MAG: helix-turn-helix domain-containing protein [Sandaracinaceae bacterium]